MPTYKCVTTCEWSLVVEKHSPLDCTLVQTRSSKEVEKHVVPEQTKKYPWQYDVTAAQNGIHTIVTFIFYNYLRWGIKGKTLLMKYRLDAVVFSNFHHLHISVWGNGWNACTQKLHQQSFDTVSSYITALDAHSPGAAEGFGGWVGVVVWVCVRG